jgi:hypothetical protein
MNYQERNLENHTIIASIIFFFPENELAAKFRYPLSTKTKLVCSS